MFLFQKGSHLHRLLLSKKYYYHFPLPRNAVTIADSVEHPSDATIAKLVLESDPRTVSEALTKPTIQWTPDLPHRAVRTFLSMAEHGIRQDLHSFNTLLDILCKSKRVETAHSLLKTLTSRFRPDTVTYNILANGYCLIKRTPMALRVLKEMVQRGIEPTMVTYNTMLKGYFRSNQIKEAWEFYLEMKKRKCEIDVVTYTTVIHGFGVAGDVKKAKRVFHEMVKEGVVPNVATYNALIQVLCKKDSVENAVVVFEEMAREGVCVPNVVTYNVVIRGLCHVGDMERALGFMERMGEHGLRACVQTYNVVIRYFCDAGEVEKALEVFGKMGDGSCLPNLDTYNVLISAMFVRKKSEDLVVAGKLLMEMVDRGFLPRKFTFNRVLNGLVITGNQDFAKEILRMQSRYSKLKEDNLHGSELLKVYCLFNWRACPHSVILTKFLHSGELSGDEPTISENLALKVSSFRCSKELIAVLRRTKWNEKKINYQNGQNNETYFACYSFTTLGKYYMIVLAYPCSYNSRVYKIQQKMTHVTVPYFLQAYFGIQSLLSINRKSSADEPMASSSRCFTPFL
ncbi:Pentatricopeptide repeat-containing protein, mitochondrial [Glycine soja]|nr:Pentatricopeptide repeat-containing protein, mitochondrial [Glycine soja]